MPFGDIGITQTCRFLRSAKQTLVVGVVWATLAAGVRDSLLLDAELRAYAAGTATGGDGPSFLQSKKREYARELNKARKMGEELLQSDAEGLTIDPAASFRPTDRKKRTQEATRKDKVNRPKQTAATGTFAVTDKRDRPSHTTPSSSSHVPAPDLLSSNYSLVPARERHSLLIIRRSYECFRTLSEF